MKIESMVASPRTRLCEFCKAHPDELFAASELAAEVGVECRVRGNMPDGWRVRVGVVTYYGSPDAIAAYKANKDRA